MPPTGQAEQNAALLRSKADTNRLQGNSEPVGHRCWALPANDQRQIETPSSFFEPETALYPPTCFNHGHVQVLRTTLPLLSLHQARGKKAP